jgi:acetyl-CoA acetyltransferase family protein
MTYDRTRHTLYNVLLTTALLSPLSAVFAQATSPRQIILLDRIVAVINDEVITQKELDARIEFAFKQLKQQGTTAPPRPVIAKQLLERLINDRVQLQLSKEFGVRIDDAELDKAIARIAEQNKISVPELRDAIQKDGLWCAFDACLMGLGTDRYTEGNISRDVQDDLAMKSNQRAAAAIAAGKFVDEIVPVSIPQRKGDALIVDTDEGVRASTTMESLASLKPAFDKAGTITAGNASQISDAGSAIVMMSKRAAEKRGIKPLGEFVSYGMVAGPDNASLLHQPSRSILRALERAGKKVSDVDLFEINEAFAAVGIASMRELGISDDIVNVNGGAIALGHPIGMSGNRLALTLLHELKRRGGGMGAAALCGGGGQGDALVVRTI